VLVQVGVEGLLVAHRVQARAGDHHRLGAAADLVARVGAEVLDHHLGLLGDVVGVQAHVAGERLGGLLFLDLGVVLGRLDEAVVGPVGGVVGEHVEDEALLDSLAHAVEVEGHGLTVGAGAAEDLERLVLGRRRETEEGEVLLLAAGGHGLDDLFFVVMKAISRGLLGGLLGDVDAGEHVLRLLGALAALRAVRLVDDHRVAALRQLADLLGDEGELLQRRDDDRRAGLERLGELGGALVDALNDALLVLELVDGVLQLLVEHAAVGDDDDGVEDLDVVV